MNKQFSRGAATFNTLVLYALLGVSASASGLFLSFFGAFFLDGAFGIVVLIAGLSLTVWRWRSALIRAASVEGKSLSASDYPWLHRIVCKACASAQTQPVTDIVLVTDYGIALVEVPGIAWRRKRTLVIGIELMQSVDARTFAVAVQHAVTSAKGRIGSVGWLSRQLGALTLIDACLARTGWDAALSRRLRGQLQRHVAQCNGLMRQHVLSVDNMVARAGRSALVARSIARMAVQERILTEAIWPNFWARADIEASPSYLPHAGIRVAVELPTRTELHCAFARVLADAPDETRPTPCLRERLDGLGERGAFLDEETRQPSAASVLFAGHYATVLAEFDRQWLAENQATWTERYASRKADLVQPRQVRPTQHQTLERLARARAKQQAMSANAVGASAPRMPEVTDNFAYAQRWVSTVVSSDPHTEFAG
ncbi:hypothetical protein GCM10025771_30980 [Niveibacterium umoris]|uniref:Peptidase M48 domain-containing protein n=1 Tax=Niveibacterium umoris TaxID=1193620 RepID=A0A840BFA0_9RHOO|nr:hypothetical protein [Niveibacterium umoris]MBB4011710.1 hypothetical protein [Niveibacterium umoris]